jgi:hypothetical protein
MHGEADGTPLVAPALTSLVTGTSKSAEVPASPSANTDFLPPAEYEPCIEQRESLPS